MQPWSLSLAPPAFPHDDDIRRKSGDAIDGGALRRDASVSTDHRIVDIQCNGTLGAPTADTVCLEESQLLKARQNAE